MFGITRAGIKREPPPAIFYGWIIVAASFLIDTAVYGTQYTFGVFFKPIQEEFGWSRTLVSGANSVFWAGIGVFSILIGICGDRFGPRRVLSVAAVIGGVALFLVSRTNAVWQLYLFYGILFSLGVSGVWTLVIATTSRWFIKKRGLALGIIAAGTGMGTVLVPPISRLLISAYGWRSAYVLVGLGFLVFVFAAAQLLKRDPAEMNRRPYGADEERMSVTRSAGQPGMTFVSALRHRSIWALGAMHLCASISLQMIMAHLVNHVTDIGIDALTAANFIGVIGGTSVAGRLIIGGVSDRIGRRRAFIICALVDAAAILWLLAAKSVWMFFAFSLLFGFFYGGWIPLFPALTAEIFGTRHLGPIYGVVNTVSAAGGVIGPILAGYIFDVSSSYSLAFVLGSVAMLLAAAITTLLERPSPYSMISGSSTASR